MDTPSNTAPLFNAFMHDLAKQLVPLIIEQIRTQTQAESMGLIALDPNNLSLPVYTLVQNDVAIRDQIRDMIDDTIDPRLTDAERSISRLEDNPSCNVDISDNDDFTDLKSRVSTLEERVAELEENAGIKIDADDSDFSDAVLQVLRNTI